MTVCESGTLPTVVARKDGEAPSLSDVLREAKAHSDQMFRGENWREEDFVVYVSKRERFEMHTISKGKRYVLWVLVGEIDYDVNGNLIEAEPTEPIEEVFYDRTELLETTLADRLHTLEADVSLLKKTIRQMQLKQENDDYEGGEREE